MHKKRSLVLSLVILISLGLAGATLGIANAMQSGALSQSAVGLQQVDRTMASAVHPSGPEEVSRPGQPILQDAALASRPNSSQWNHGYGVIPDRAAETSDGQLPEEFLRRSGEGALLAAGSSRNSSATSLASTPPLPGDMAAVICLSSSRVWGVVSGGTVTVTVNGEQMGADQADHIGYFWTTLYDSNGNGLGLTSGDQVAIYLDGTPLRSLTLRSISGQINADEDTVTGKIGGSSFPIDVTVYVPFIEPSMTSYSQTVSTDGLGNFQVDFSGEVDLFTWDAASVGYRESGVEVHRHVYATPGLMVRPYPYNWVYGTASAGEEVTVTVYLSDNVTIKDSALVGTGQLDGFFFVQMGADLLESNIVVAQPKSDSVMSRTVDRLTMQLDAENDRITGEAEPGATVRGEMNHLTALGWKEVTFNTTAEASGMYTIDLSSLVDILPGDTASLMVADAEGDELNPRSFLPSIEVYPIDNRVDGRASYQPGGGTGGSPVTMTLYSSFYGSTTILSQTLDSNGYYDFSYENYIFPYLRAGDIITIESGAIPWQGVVQIGNMSISSDLENDQFSGSVATPSDRVELFGYNYLYKSFPLGGSFDLVTFASSPFNAVPLGFDVNYNQGLELAHRTEDGYKERIYRETGGIGALLNANVVLANLAPPGSAFTITLYDSTHTFKAQINDISQEPIGFSGWHDFWSSGEQILSGDYIHVQADNGFDLEHQVPNLSIAGDPDTDLVYGQAPPNSLVFIHSDADGEGFVAANQNGEFIIAIDQLQEVWGDGELEEKDYVTVQYWTQDNTWFTTNIVWSFMRVNYGHDWVGGDYEAGHAFTITVKDSTGNTKGIAYVESRQGGGWGNPGFETRWENWLLEPPDIQTGDWVYISSDDGYENAIQVGTVTGSLDFDENTVNGTILANWFSGDLNVRCEVWVEGGPDGIDTSADANGGSYACDFDDRGWDLQAGQDVAVRYMEPDGDLVINVFPEIRPHVAIYKWTDGNPAVGGNVLFKVQYWNQNRGTAENVLITDTLEGMSYISNTSGASATINPGGDGVILDLGDVPGQSTGYFELFAQVDAAQDEPVTNTIQIATSSANDEGFEGEKISTWTGTVQANETDVYVNKSAWTWNPVPGYDFVYAVNACNNGSTDSATVLLTDTLPLSTTLVTWWGQYGGWSEKSSSEHQLVVSRPSLGAWQCTEVYIKVTLDSAAWQDMELVNLATIGSNNDIDTNNNQSEIYHNVGSARSTDAIDLSLRKDWQSGRIVPGGELVYHVSYRNEGNTPANGVKITSTLPNNSTFIDSWYEDEYGRTPVVPSQVTDDIVVWDIGTLDNGYEGRFSVQVKFDWEAEPGTPLTHTMDISVLPGEFDTVDNHIAWSDTLQDYGPNLRVDKQTYRWNWEGNLQYELHIFNMGSEILEDVWVTDTYPISTTFDTSWTGHGPKMEMEDHPSEHQFVVWIERLNPGESANVIYQVNLEDEILYKEGISLTNQLQAPLENDVDLSDNYDQLTVYTGPDVFVEKWLSGGKVEPGELITFTVKFGNSNRWPWDTDPNFETGSFLTDTLPAELTFVRAAGMWNQDEDWGPCNENGNILTWCWGPMWAESTWFTQIVARVADTVHNGDTFTNTIAAYSANPDDVEPFWDNNESSVRMTAEVHVSIFLPVILR